MLQVYPASKLHHAHKWKELNNQWYDAGVHVYARWFMFHVGNTPDSPEFAKLFWQHDHEDIRRSDALMLYGEEGDKLRGGLVEAGIALALEIPVIVVGDHPDYGTWQHHSGVFRVPNLGRALDLFVAMQYGRD